MFPPATPEQRAIMMTDVIEKCLLLVVDLLFVLVAAEGRSDRCFDELKPILDETLCEQQQQLRSRPERYGKAMF
jgi:hypothetical protein